MFSFLENGKTQSIIALITLGVSIFVSVAQKKRKSLSYRVLAETKLFRHVNGEFKITYQDVPVQSIYLIIIKVLNDGNVPIEKKDFDRELTFSLGSDAHVLSAECIHVSPENLKPDIDHMQSSVTVQPLLLNCKYEFDVKILCEGYTGNIEIDTIIAGGEVKFFKSSMQNNDYLLFRISPGIFIAFIVLLFYSLIFATVIFDILSIPIAAGLGTILVMLFCITGLKLQR